MRRTFESSGETPETNDLHLQIMTEDILDRLRDWATKEYRGQEDPAESAFCLVSDIRVLKRYLEGAAKPAGKVIFRRLERDFQAVFKKKGERLLDLASLYSLEMRPTQRIVDWAQFVQGAQRQEGLEDPDIQEEILDRGQDWIRFADRLDLLLSLAEQEPFRAVIQGDAERRQRWSEMTGLRSEIERTLRRHVHFLHTLEGLLKDYCRQMGIRDLPEWWPWDLTAMKHPPLDRLLVPSPTEEVRAHLDKCDYCVERRSGFREISSFFSAGGIAVEQERSALEIPARLLKAGQAAAKILSQALEVFIPPIPAAVPSWKKQSAWGLAAAATPAYSAEDLAAYKKLAETETFEVYTFSEGGQQRLSILRNQKTFRPSRVKLTAFYRGRPHEPEIEVSRQEMTLKVPDLTYSQVAREETQAPFEGYLVSISYGKETLSLLIQQGAQKRPQPPTWLLRLQEYLNESAFNKAVQLICNRLNRSRTSFEKLHLLELLEDLWRSKARDVLTPANREKTKRTLQQHRW